MYVGVAKRGTGLGRLARRAHRVSGLRGLRGLWLGGAYYSGARLDDVVRQRLGQADYDSSGNYIGPPITTPTYAPTPGAGLTPQEASLISQAIATGGQIGVKAVTPVPTVSYNPTTGTYSATGGAALPAGLGLNTSLAGVSTLFSSPLLILAILGIGAIVLLKR